MGFIRKGIAKLGVLTMIVATTVCLAAVVLLVRLSDTMPNIMLSPFMQSYAGTEENANVFTEGRGIASDCEYEQNGRDVLRDFVEGSESLNAITVISLTPCREYAGGVCIIDLKNAVKRTE